jgi:hypothetical protein
MPCTFTYLHSSAQRNSIYHAQICPTTTHSCEQAMYCTDLSVWSVELLASAAAMCCALSAPMELFPRLYAHVCVMNDTAHVRSSRCAIPYIQPSARSYTPMGTCRQHTQYDHTCMPCTYTYRHSSAQRNSIYHAQTCPTTTHSCGQDMYCTHWSVWSVELWASASAMCCAPSSPMELS